MGASSSKTAHRLPTTARKYPTRPPIPTPPHYPDPDKPGASQSQGSYLPNHFSNAPKRNGRKRELKQPLTVPLYQEPDDKNPSFAHSLRKIGPVTPSTSPSSRTPSNTTNTSFLILSARSRLAQDAEAEFARARTSTRVSQQEGEETRRQGFLDVQTVHRVLVLRDLKGVPEEEIERVLGLQRGLVGVLGGRGVVGVVGGG